MQRCIDLAQKGMGRVAPNPLVGCVVVFGDEIIGEGYHSRFGELHAEIKALESVEDKSLLGSSTLYVNLEPCNHFGKTPPCTRRIIEAGVPKVVIGLRDPNIQIEGRGIEKLREAGIEVIEGILSESNYELNRRFLTLHKKKRPYIILKWAQTSDGFMAKAGDVKTAISNEQSKQLVHQWRGEEQAIMVGTNTALIDNPQLTVREIDGVNPLRVVLDRELQIPQNSHLLDGKTSTIVVNEHKSDREHNVEHLKLDFDQDLLTNVLNELASRDIQSILVEGGAQLHSSFIAANLWDEARIITSPITFGGGIEAPEISGEQLKTESLGNNFIAYLTNSRE